MILIISFPFFLSFLLPRQSSPETSYVKAVDVWMFMCILLSIMTLFEYGIVLMWVAKKKFNYFNSMSMSSSVACRAPLLVQSYSTLSWGWRQDLWSWVNWSIANIVVFLPVLLVLGRELIPYLSLDSIKRRRVGMMVQDSTCISRVSHSLRLHVRIVSLGCDKNDGIKGGWYLFMRDKGSRSFARR